MIIPMFSCGCLNSKLWGSRAESTGHAFYTRLGAVGHRCWPWPSRARDLARGARGKSIHCAGLAMSAIAAGLHSVISPHGPNAILQVTGTIADHSPALAPGISLALHHAELFVQHVERLAVVVTIVVLIDLLVPAIGVAVAATLHARIILHLINVSLQVAIVVVGHGPTEAQWLLHGVTAHRFATFRGGVAHRHTSEVVAIVVVLAPGVAAIGRRRRCRDTWGQNNNNGNNFG